MDRYRKRRFARNLDALLTARCVTRKEAAAEAGVPYQWLRRAVADGISRPDKRSRGHLEALANYLGLTGIDGFWERDLYVPPPPSSIKDEADRLAELMREYALDAGADDPLLGAIVARMEQVVGERRARRKKLAEEEEGRRQAEEEAKARRRNAEELDDRLAAAWMTTGGPKGLAAWEERRERMRLEEEERRRVRDEQVRSFRDDCERMRAAGQVLDFFRLEVLARWKAVGLPRLEEVEVTVAEVASLAERLGLKTIRGIAPHASDLWLAKYAQALGTTPDRARRSIQQAVSDAFGVGWDSPGEVHDAASVGDSASHAAASDVVHGPPPWWRDGYVPPSSIEDGAGKLGEEMRRYVLLVGEEDAALKGIVEQVRAAVRSHHGPTAPEREAEPGVQPPVRPQGAGEVRMSVAERVAAAKRAIARGGSIDPGREGRGGPTPTGEAAVRPPSPWPERIGVEVARQALGEMEARCLGPWRTYGLPRIDEVVVTPGEVADHAGLLRIPAEDVGGFAFRVIWLPRYARLLGKNNDEAIDFIRDHIAACVPGSRVETAPPQAGPGGDGVKPGPSEEEARAREEARPLVARVVAILSPEQAEHFFRGYPSPARAESDLENELLNRLSGGRFIGDDKTPQSPDEAVRGLVAEIVEDFEKSRHGEVGDDLLQPFSDPEAVIAPRKSLDHRHGDDPSTDDDHDERPPVGIALEAEIARSVAEDRESLERRVNDFWEMLGDTPLPGGSGTYRDRSEGLGDRMTIGSAALRACGDDLGKALRWLTDRVDRAIKDEESAARRHSTPRAEEKAPPPAKRPVRKKGPVVTDPEDIREAVVEAHRIGMPTDEIIADLRGRPDLPDWVRRAKGSVLRGEIGKIVARYESELEDEAAPDEFDAQAGDDRRNWEREDD
ncbi:hypothetical protein [Paludisphaera borealis]|uniref:Uncharacterized protein n=1 Tax=Paludisphaera borealis TaxID=1387353 RepID=A0A1U7CWW2_9BACT|nr:hypothetical protein [Paludisphaera borealis]APW63379.1 hypothetical protein BSF38_04945 [Paludisphaera borealis]